MQLERVRKNHMDVEWHEYTDENGKNTPVINASITEKASIIGRVGIMFLSCGTGAWRVRSSMNALAEAMGITCTADIGLMSIEYTCFDGQNGFTQSLCLTNTGVNTSKLNRLEHFIRDFETEGKNMSGEELHSYLDEIERIHGLYSPAALGLAAAIDYINKIGFETMQERELTLTKRALEGLKAIPKVHVLGSELAEEHTGILTFTIEDVHPHDVSAVLESDGVAVRAGHHCAQPLLEYLGVRSATRASLMFYNTEEEVDALVKSVAGVRRRMGYGE